MLEKLHKLQCHFVTLPAICCARDILGSLDQQTQPVPKSSTEANVNKAVLDAILRIARVSGYLHVASNGEWMAPSEVPSDDLVTDTNDVLNAIISNDAKIILKCLNRFVANRTQSCFETDGSLSAICESFVLTALIDVFSKQLHLHDIDVLADVIDKQLHSFPSLEALIMRMQVVRGANGESLFSNEIRWMLRNHHLFGLTLSYCRTLASLRGLLYGTSSTVYDSEGLDDHVDRGMNVDSSEKQHSNYFGCDRRSAGLFCEQKYLG
jgi:hypothetical protein